MIRALFPAAALAALTLASPVRAGTDLEGALANGGTRLTSDQIAQRLVGHTVTARLGEKRFLFYYSADNVLTGEMIGGDWSDTGYYGITDDDRVCVSITKDKGRLRCLTVVEQDGTLRKYNTAGKATFELLEFHDGKTF